MQWLDICNFKIMAVTKINKKLPLSSSSDVRNSDGNIKSVAIVFWRHHAHLIISIDTDLL